MLEKQIQMVDLRKQYERLRSEIDPAMQTVINACAFINGPQVKGFCNHLSDYLGIPYAIPCGNGTDALQISLMALDLHPGDEVIVPAFTYIAAAEVALALGLVPVLVDVDPGTFNIDPEKIEDALSEKTRAIIAVHLFGQCCDMEPILRIASRHNLYVIEDNAQSIGANYTFSDGTVKKGIGNFIRDWSFDEFPQFWNVLKGDMSLVGTRPPTEDEWVRYELHHRSRLAIKPGITGMWQVSGRSNITDFEKVVELDRYYILNWSLGLDVKIIFRTVPEVVKKNGSM